MAKNVTIQRIVGVLLHRIKFIILATVVMGLLFFMYSRFVIAPMYSTSTMIYVQNYSSSQRANANADTKSTTPKKADDDTAKKTTNEENQKIYPADISASANLAEICVTLFKNSDEMTALYDGCTVNVDVTDGTFFITITVDGTDAQKCANVANQLAEKAAEVYNSKFSYGQIGTLRQAKVPSAPYAPSNTKNMLIGAAIGLIASCLISILIELIDTTINLRTIFRISTVFLYLPKFPTLRTRVKEELWLLILNYLKRKTIKKITDRIFLFPIRASLQLLSRIRLQELILCSRFPQKKKMLCRNQLLKG